MALRSGGVALACENAVFCSKALAAHIGFSRGVYVQLNAVGLSDLCDPHSEKFSRRVDPAKAVRSCRVPKLVVRRAVAVEYGVVAVLCAVDPEQIALFENTGSQGFFLGSEINAVNSQPRPGWGDVAHDGQRVDLAARRARKHCRLVENVPYKAGAVQGCLSGNVELAVCAAAVAARIAVVVGNVGCSQIIVIVFVTFHPVHVNIIVDPKGFEKGPVARDRAAAVVGSVPACRLCNGS